MKKIITLLLVVMLTMVGCSSKYQVKDNEKYEAGVNAIVEVKQNYEDGSAIPVVHYTRSYVESISTVINLVSGKFGNESMGGNSDYRYGQIQEALSWDTSFEKEKSIAKSTLTEKQYEIVQIYEEEQIGYCNELRDILVKINDEYDGKEVNYVLEMEAVFKKWNANTEKIAENIASNAVMNVIGN